MPIPIIPVLIASAALLVWRGFTDGKKSDLTASKPIPKEPKPRQKAAPKASTPKPKEAPKASTPKPKEAPKASTPKPKEATKAPRKRSTKEEKLDESKNEVDNQD